MSGLQQMMIGAGGGGAQYNVLTVTAASGIVTTGSGTSTALCYNNGATGNSSAYCSGTAADFTMEFKKPASGVVFVGLTKTPGTASANANIDVAAYFYYSTQINFYKSGVYANTYSSTWDTAATFYYVYTAATGVVKLYMGSTLLYTFSAITPGTMYPIATYQEGYNGTPATLVSNVRTINKLWNGTAYV